MRKIRSMKCFKKEFFTQENIVLDVAGQHKKKFFWVSGPEADQRPW